MTAVHDESKHPRQLGGPTAGQFVKTTHLPAVTRPLEASDADAAAAQARIDAAEREIDELDKIVETVYAISDDVDTVPLDFALGEAWDDFDDTGDLLAYSRAIDNLRDTVIPEIAAEAGYNSDGPRSGPSDAEWERQLAQIDARLKAVAQRMRDAAS